MLLDIKTQSGHVNSDSKMILLIVCDHHLKVMLYSASSH
jgi:hypothetical protein